MSLTSQLASYTSLDDETISSQILPYLNTLDADAVRHHLLDLIGSDTSDKRRFIEEFLASRSDPKQDDVATQVKSEASASSSTSQSRPQASSSSIPSSSATPTPTTASTSSPFVLSPSEEMKRIESVMTLLGSNTPSDQIACYCQGRSHSLCSEYPICLSCGLLLCSENTFHPYQLGSSCPSCQTIFLDDTSRTSLLASLTQSKSLAESAELQRIEALRQERKQSKTLAEKARTEREFNEASLFPELSGGDLKARDKALQLDYAMGRKSRQNTTAMITDDDTPTSRTASKARVLTIGKKGKVYYGNAPSKKKKKSKAEDKKDSTPAPAPAPCTTAVVEAQDEPSSPPPSAAIVDIRAECKARGLTYDSDDDGHEHTHINTSSSNAKGQSRRWFNAQFDISYIPLHQRQSTMEEEELQPRATKEKARAKVVGSHTPNESSSKKNKKKNK
ncbi:unnamed protein product [Sympodiomycopsis kandeliae]